MDPAQFLGLRHVALKVRDVQKSVDFYCRVLDMSIEWKPDDDNVYLTSGGDNLAIHKMSSDEYAGGAQKLHHLGFIVRRPENVDQWADRVQKEGVKIAQPVKTHRDGARSFYFYDPDDILIQLIYHPPISDQSK